MQTPSWEGEAKGTKEPCSPPAQTVRALWRHPWSWVHGPSPSTGLPALRTVGGKLGPTVCPGALSAFCVLAAWELSSSPVCGATFSPPPRLWPQP